MYIDKFDLTGKVSIITGGNKGLGASMTAALAEAGSDIAVVCRSDCSLIKETVEKIGRQFVHVPADLTNIASIDEIVSKVVAVFNHVDILVNNSGSTIRKPALEYTEQEWKNVLDLDLTSVFFMCQRVAKEFIKQGKGGKIISTASIVSFQGGLNNTPYVAAKSAVAGITKTMANEWAKHNIQVNAIAPGFMLTDLTAEVFKNETRRAQVNARIPAGRWGTPEDLGGLVIFLASAASDYMTGVTIPVDGGWLSF